MTAPVVVSGAVEGDLDEAVLRRLLRQIGAAPGTIYGKSGKLALRERISGYNNAARRTPWVVLVDLNADAECAPPLRSTWLPRPEPGLCFRIAVREVEAWLMADRNTLARFLSVARARVPRNPEEEPRAKESVVNLARKSRRSDIRNDMVPREGSGRSVGPAYTSRLIEYVERHWRPEEAAQHAESLQRAMRCIERLVRRAT